jgi:hypothetical protein
MEAAHALTIMTRRGRHVSLRLRGRHGVPTQKGVARAERTSGGEAKRRAPPRQAQESRRMLPFLEQRGADGRLRAHLLRCLLDLGEGLAAP